MVNIRCSLSRSSPQLKFYISAIPIMKPKDSTVIGCKMHPQYCNVTAYFFMTPKAENRQAKPL